LEKFKTFITEEKSEKYKILVISAEPDNDKLFHTAQRFVDEGKKLGNEVYVIKVEGAIISYENNEYTISNSGDDKGTTISADNTVAFVRGSVRLKKSYLDLLSQLEKIGVCMVNSRQTIELSSDKYRTYLKLQDVGLTQPKTVLIPNEKTWKDALEKLDTKFPIIMKTLEGSKGVGVLFIESERQIESLVQLLYSQNNDVDLLIQEYIKTDGDIRVIVLGDTIVAAMKRDVIEGDFRSNVSQGASVNEYPLTELEKEHCLLASKSIGGSWTAVDFIPSKKTKTEPPYIIEVNHSPGTKGIEEASNINVVKSVIDFYSNPKNRHLVPTESGRFERLELKGLGEIVANFDTGNSARAIMHTDKWEVKGKNVVWESFGKTYTHKLVRLQKFKQGKWSFTSSTPIERPVILLDVEFNGKLYKDHEFLLDERGHKTTKCLMNQLFMRKSNIMINPAKTFVVSTKHGVKPDGTFEDDGFDLF